MEWGWRWVGWLMVLSGSGGRGDGLAPGDGAGVAGRHQEPAVGIEAAEPQVAGGVGAAEGRGRVVDPGEAAHEAGGEGGEGVARAWRARLEAVVHEAVAVEHEHGLDAWSGKEWGEPVHGQARARLMVGASRLIW